MLDNIQETFRLHHDIELSNIVSQLHKPRKKHIIVVDLVEVELEEFHINGVVLYGQNNSQYIIDEIWKNHCYYEGPELVESDVVLDIGANQGFYSVFAAKYCKQVIAIEPDPINFAVLQKNIAANNLEDIIIAIMAAVGSTQKEINLFRPMAEGIASSGMVSSDREYLKLIGLDTEMYEFTVQQTTLDVIITQYCSSLDKVFIKIDCEGAELDILYGLGDGVSCISAITMETHGCYSDSEIFHKVKSLGFSVIEFSPMQSKYTIGTITATRNFECEVTIPVVILKSIYICISNEMCRIDASNSFSCIANTTLGYNWYVNGVLRQEDQSMLELRHTELHIGINLLELKVVDILGNMCTERATIYRLIDDYYNMQVTLLETECENIIDIVNDITYYGVSSSHFPTMWTPKTLHVLMYCVEGACAKLEYLGEVYNLSTEHSEVDLIFVPTLNEIKFKILAPPTTKISLRWWFI